MKKRMPFILAITFIAWILLLATQSIAQNPFPPSKGTVTKTTYAQQCSGLTKKGEQCHRMVHTTKEQSLKPVPQYCFQHKNQTN